MKAKKEGDPVSSSGEGTSQGVQVVALPQNTSNDNKSYTPPLYHSVLEPTSKNVSFRG